MKFSRIIAALAILGLGAFLYLYYLNPNPLAKPLAIEWVDNTFPEKVDEEGSLWTILPYGYTLGPWPRNFHGEPIVTKMTYQKGPPAKFIQHMVQIWKPIEVELSLEGPKTIDSALSALEWKNCLMSRHLCSDAKKKLASYALADLIKLHAKELSIKWFDGLDPLSARGIPIHFEADTYFIDRYVVFTEKGVAQAFSLKYANNPIGLEAKDLFSKMMGGLKVKDDIEGSKIWIQNKIKLVNLDQIRKISDTKLRYAKMIEAQSLIFSHLSVDPSTLTPFFHLAGITHLLAMDLLKQEKKYYENQESWILSAKPLLETLITYAKDFEHPETFVQNMEALLQDVLLLQQKISTGNH